MAVFQYKALGSGGAVTEGTIDAGGRADGIRQLESQGLNLPKVVEGRGEGHDHVLVAVLVEVRDADADRADARDVGEVDARVGQQRPEL